MVCKSKHLAAGPLAGRTALDQLFGKEPNRPPKTKGKWLGIFSWINKDDNVLYHRHVYEVTPEDTADLIINTKE